MIAFLEKFGSLVIQCFSRIVYETRSDSVLSLTRLSGRELLLNDVISHCDETVFGRDPKPKFEVWVSPDDFEYEMKREGRERYGLIKFVRKIDYVPESLDPIAVGIAFVANERKIRHGNLRSRKVKSIFSLVSVLLELAKKKRL